MRDDGPGIRDELTLHHLRRPVRRNLGANTRGQRQVDIEIGCVESQRQQDIARGNLPRLDAYRAHAVGERAHRRTQHPGAFGIIGFEPKNYATLSRPRQAHIDAIKLPLLTAAPVVNNQISIFEAKFAQIVAVETGRAQTVNPSEQAGDILRASADHARRDGPVGRRRLRQCRSCDRNRFLVVGAGKHRDTAVGFDAYRQFRAHEVETLRTHLPAEQAIAGDTDFRLRGARHHGAVGIAHDDVAQAQRGTAILVALDLRTADHDGLVAAEILLDRSLEPGRRDLKVDRTARQPQPKGAEGEQHDAEHDARDPEGAPYRRLARELDGALPQSVPLAPRKAVWPVMARRLMVLVMRPIAG